jgi:hypothetical protein
MFFLSLSVRIFVSSLLSKDVHVRYPKKCRTSCHSYFGSSASVLMDKRVFSAPCVKCLPLRGFFAFLCQNFFFRFQFGYSSYSFFSD